MKNYIKTLTLLLLSSIYISSSCTKNTPANTEEQLPPETQTGAYTFGCKVDGKIYTAKGKDGLLATQFVWGGGVYSDSSITIGASNGNQKFSFDLSVKYNGSLGLLYTSTYPYQGSFQDNNNGTLPGNSNTYKTDSFNTGKVNLKYIIQANIISGTFEMDAKNANGKVIRITEGRFDIGR
jgi:hypothetical protein